MKVFNRLSIASSALGAAIVLLLCFGWRGSPSEGVVRDLTIVVVAYAALQLGWTIALTYKAFEQSELLKQYETACRLNRAFCTRESSIHFLAAEDRAESVQLPGFATGCFFKYSRASSTNSSSSVRS
jgi:hypothetical protein